MVPRTRIARRVVAGVVLVAALLAAYLIGASRRGQPPPPAKPREAVPVASAAPLGGPVVPQGTLVPQTGEPPPQPSGKTLRPAEPERVPGR